jgi:hypothetical protein
MRALHGVNRFVAERRPLVGCFTLCNFLMVNHLSQIHEFSEKENVEMLAFLLHVTVDMLGNEYSL